MVAGRAVRLIERSSRGQAIDLRQVLRGSFQPAADVGVDLVGLRGPAMTLATTSCAASQEKASSTSVLPRASQTPQLLDLRPVASVM